MSNLKARLERLEKLAAQRGRRQAERGQYCGVIPWIVRNGFIRSCVYVPCDRIPTWQEWGSLARAKAACPDVGTCEYTDVCRSGEAS